MTVERKKGVSYEPTIQNSKNTSVVMQYSFHLKEYLKVEPNAAEDLNAHAAIVRTMLMEGYPLNDLPRAIAQVINTVVGKRVEMVFGQDGVKRIIEKGKVKALKRSSKLVDKAR